MKHSLPDLKEIEAANERITGVAARTPLVESPALSRLTGAEVYLKLECFQPIKVFKIRGAYNKLSRTKARRVVAASSGNHGIAVAYSSHLLDKKATIVVPETAVKEKVDAIAGFGAKVVKAGKLSEEREAKARRIAGTTESVFIHPFNDHDVIAGQGTCGLEIADQLDWFDSVIVPVGGGGLISGISIALKSKAPSVRIFGVEPLRAAKLSEALKAGMPVRVPSQTSLADGLIPTALADLTYEACSRHVERAFAVSEGEIFHATKTLVRQAGIVVEPSGAVPLIPLLEGGLFSGKRVVLVVSGGNISLALLARILAS